MRLSALLMALVASLATAGLARAEITTLNATLSNDYSNALWIDMDQNGEQDIKLELIRRESRNMFGYHEVDIWVRATSALHAAVAGGAPLEEAELVSNVLEFGRSASLIRFSRQQNTERSGGDWFQGPEPRRAYMPVRLRVPDGIRLGWIEIEIDGYGKATVLRYALAPEPGALCAAGGLAAPAGGDTIARDCAGDCGGHAERSEPMRLAMN